MIALEICCYNVECAVAAERSGADRIELCSGQLEGGLTPSLGMLQLARERITIPVHPIVRPRGGDFCYSESELECIRRDLVQIRTMGFPGVVFGVLDDEGHINLPVMRELMSLCKGMAVTFHRAFDMCVKPFTALDELTELGVTRILTSGQQQSAEVGLPLLRQLIEKSCGPVIMPGSGVRLTNLGKFCEIGVKELHSSAGHHVSSSMRYRKAGVTLCSDSEFDEFSHYCVDTELVGAMKNALLQFKHA